MADQSERLFASTMGNLEDELFKFVKTGKFSFASLSESFIDELIKMEIRMAASEIYKMLREGVSVGSGGESSGGGGSIFGDIFSSVGDWFGGGSSYEALPDFVDAFAFAKGGVPGGKGISAYSNTIVNSPTIFPFARGTGLMGEAGPEAIMPLTRVNGKLGVQAIGGNGGGSNVQVNIINNGNSQVKTQERQQGNSRIIDVMIEQVKDAVAQDINSGRGSVSSALNKTFQLSRVPSSF
jgi:phage-related minor tail protein